MGVRYLFLGQVEILCPDRKQFLQSLENSDFPLKFEYLCRNTLIRFAKSCVVVRTSSTVRLSISIDTLFMDDQKVVICAYFVYINMRSSYVF